MIWTKICGITRPQDAVAAVKFGARAVGFNFYGLSPRAISVGEAAKIARELPRDVKKVGIFVNEKDLETIEEIAKKVPLDIIQLHGDERPGFCARLSKKVVKAFRPRVRSDVEAMTEYKSVHAWLVDAAPPGRPSQFGGTGQPAEWPLAKEAKRYGMPVILAGGLTASNVVMAIRAVEPAGIDVNSGVESEPGIKDVYRMRLLFDTIRRHEDELRAKGQKVSDASISSVRMRLDLKQQRSSSSSPSSSDASGRTKPPTGWRPRREEPPGKDLLDRAPPWKGTSGEIDVSGAGDAPLSDRAPS